MAKILILDRDQRSREQLEQALAAEHTVTSTPMMRSACLIVAQQSQDIAILSLEEGGEAIAALHRFQPQLPIILAIPSESVAVPEAVRAQIQRICVGSAGTEAVRSAVDDVLGGDRDPLPTGPQSAGADQLLQRAIITARLKLEVESTNMVGLLLSRDNREIGYAGHISEVQVPDVVHDVHRKWQEGGERCALVQFHLLRGSAVDVLLYTLSLGNGYLLTIISPAESRLGLLRAQAERLATHLQVAFGPATTADYSLAPSPTLMAEDPARPETHNFAIAWRSETELPAILHQPLRIALDRAARTTDCVLTHAEIGADCVSVVVQCPADKESAWIAQRLKYEAESDIQQRLGVDVRLWDSGHLALETSQPFSESALALYVQGV